MAFYGKSKEFVDEKHRSWEEYVERLECFFVANDIGNDESKCTVLLCVCGTVTYSTLNKNTSHS